VSENRSVLDIREDLNEQADEEIHRLSFDIWGRYGFDRGSLSLSCESRGSASLKRQRL